MEVKKNSNKVNIIPSCDEVIKKAYKSLKLRHEFGTFMKNCRPFEGATYNDYNYLIPNIRINKKLLINTRGINDIYDIFVKIKILYIISAKSLTFPFNCHIKQMVMDGFVNDEILKYKETHNVIPNHMAYGFKYGSITAVIGLILIFLLMWYFFSLTEVLILFVVYTFILFISPFILF